MRSIAVFTPEITAAIEKLEAKGFDFSDIKALDLPAEIRFDAITCRAWRWWEKQKGTVELADPDDREEDYVFTAWWRGVGIAGGRGTLIESMAVALSERDERAKKCGESFDDIRYFDEEDEEDFDEEE